MCREAESSQSIGETMGSVEGHNASVISEGQPQPNTSHGISVKAAADAFTSIEETTVGIYILKSQDRSEDFGIVLEGQKVLQGLDNFALAMAMLFGLMYALNLNYPPEMKHTFEVLQKIVMELEGCTLSKKAQVLRNRLYK
ncbi:Transcriptional regulator MraZ [Labeo rohita]|uniref:Transcriptional regulator MraZ n=1 Tax=Labeo rohita TaxID=84645 RepID=A0ABQ8LB60_LABRO|nr:Transcriptional regulator MraZ [Labeo rohita]